MRSMKRAKEKNDNVIFRVEFDLLTLRPRDKTDGCIEVHAIMAQRLILHLEV
jgi:hypothetical protein